MRSARVLAAKLYLGDAAAPGMLDSLHHHPSIGVVEEIKRDLVKSIRGLILAPQQSSTQLVLYVETARRAEDKKSDFIRFESRFSQYGQGAVHFLFIRATHHQELDRIPNLTSFPSPANESQEFMFAG